MSVSVPAACHTLECWPTSLTTHKWPVIQSGFELYNSKYGIRMTSLYRLSFSSVLILLEKLNLTKYAKYRCHSCYFLLKFHNIKKQECSQAAQQIITNKYRQFNRSTVFVCLDQSEIKSCAMASYFSMKYQLYIVSVLNISHSLMYMSGNAFSKWCLRKCPYFLYLSIKTLGEVCKCAGMLSLPHTPMFYHKSVPVMCGYVSLSRFILLYHCSSVSIWYEENVKDFFPCGLFWWLSFLWTKLLSALILQQLRTLMKFPNIYNRSIFLFISSMMGFGCPVSICIHTILPLRGRDNLIISNTKVITVKIALNFWSNSCKIYSCIVKAEHFSSLPCVLGASVKKWKPD